MSHTFEQVVFGLQIIHTDLLLSTRSGLDELAYCDKWRGAEICSTGGRLLAMQVGHPDEWEYTPFYDQPDTGLIMDEPDEDSLLTDRLRRDIRFWMVTLVHPYIDENGQFTSPDDDACSCYSN
ncbi:hypothetical protein ABIE05_003996 [Kosakonia cowanii]